MKPGLSSHLNRLLVLAATALTLLSAWSESRAIPRATLDLFHQVYKGRTFRILSAVHRPEPGGKPAPFLDAKGWHHRNTELPILLERGELAEVTGLFPYGDRSLFIELARPAGPEMLGFRERVRIRITVEAGPEEPGLQEEQLRGLIAQILFPLQPLQWPVKEETPPQP